MTADAIDLALLRLARRRRLQRTIDRLAPALAVSACCAGAAVVVVRLALPGLAWLAWPLVAAGALAPLALLPSAWRRRDEAAVLAGHLDGLAGAHGLAMALAERPTAARDAGWAARLERPLERLALPPLRWRAGRAAALAVPALFAALLLPQAEPRADATTPIDRLFASTAARLAAMDAAEVLPEPRAEELRAQLDRLKENADATGMDQATWEGLARLDRALGDAGDAAARRLAEAMVAAEELAAPPPPGGAPQDAVAETAARAAQQLAQLAEQAPGLLPALTGDAKADAKALAKALAAAAERGLLTPEQLEALAKHGLRPGGAGGERLDAEQARALGERLARELAERAATLGTCMGGAEGEEGEGGDGFGRALARLRARNAKPGHSEGSGHKPLAWEDRERAKGGTDAGLPPGAVLNPDGSVTLAEQLREPDPEQAAATARAAARAFDPAAADARRAATAPRHRAAVERYFAAE